MGRNFLTHLASVAALLTGGAVLAVLVFLVVSAWPLLVSGDFLRLVVGSWRPFAVDASFGVGPMILVSILMAAGTTLLAFPAAVGLVAFAHGVGPRAWRKPVLNVIQFMASIPTVVYGFVAVIVLVPMIRDFFEKTTGFSLLAAVLTMALLVLPTMALLIDARLGRQDRQWATACLAMGMTHSQALEKVLFPQARTGLVSAVVMGFCRALGDTLVALMVAGNAARVPGSILDSVRSLTSHIALVLATDTFSPEYRSVAAAALVLFLLTSGLTMSVRHLAEKGAAR